jgi:predicted regulator of Ras-like GTPase activity (Roadblock/LC7/MglB family)
MLKMILNEFLSIEGVTAAALVGRDGFVIEIVQTHPSDLDELGALCSGSISFFERNGALLKMGSLRQIIFEHQDGIMVFTPVTTEEFLIIITNTNTGLGHLAFSLATISSRVAAVI